MSLAEDGPCGHTPERIGCLNCAYSLAYDQQKVCVSEDSVFQKVSRRHDQKEAIGFSWLALSGSLEPPTFSRRRDTCPWPPVIQTLLGVEASEIVLERETQGRARRVNSRLTRESTVVSSRRPNLVII